MALPPGAVGALLDELIDDAGLFPPAQLPMGDALAAHRRTRLAPHHRILARFICAASRLDELSAALGADSDGFRLTLLVDAGPEESAVEAAVEASLDHLWQLEVVEARFGPGEAVGATLHAHLGDAAIFLEVPIAGADVGTATKAIDEIAEAGAGLKVRCGGAAAAMFPTPHELADAIVTARAAGVMLKCTAGLHHPFRHLDPADGFVHHGFVNLAVAAVLCHSRGLDAATVARILATDDPGAFHLDADRVGWLDIEATEVEVASARNAFFVGYGSCSIDEPVEDLVALGVLGGGR